MCFALLFSDNATIMECNYCLHTDHCGGEEHVCSHHKVEDGPVCFCWPAQLKGVHMIHAYARGFERGGLWKSLWDALQKVFDFLSVLLCTFMQKIKLISDWQAPLDSAAVLSEIQVLKEEFTKLPGQPLCFNLTAEALYWRAEKYLLNVMSWCL